MKRGKSLIEKDFSQPLAILTGDWHLRESQPVCRTDDFQAAQWRKVEYIVELQKELNVPVLHSGDLFDNWKPSPYLLSMAMNYLPNKFFTVYGNHDLPQHNLELAYKCGIDTLINAGKVAVLDGIHWGQFPSGIGSYDFFLQDKKINVLVWHVMTYSGNPPYPGCPDPQAQILLRKYPEYDLIVTGHNHKPFATEYEGRWLVNPGSITRQDADQQDYKPRVYVYYDDGTVKSHYLPIEEGVVSRVHLDKSEERNDRIEAFVSRLNDEWEAGVSFEENLERFAKTNSVRDSVMQIVRKAVEI